MFSLIQIVQLWQEPVKHSAISKTSSQSCAESDHMPPCEQGVECKPPNNGCCTFSLACLSTDGNARYTTCPVGKGRTGRDLTNSIKLLYRQSVLTSSALSEILLVSHWSDADCLGKGYKNKLTCCRHPEPAVGGDPLQPAVCTPSLT